MDQIKRNNALRLRCEHEIWRQRQPAKILAALQGSAYMQDGRKQLIDAGGEYLKLQDLNNWANAFRKVHPDLRTIGHKDNAKNQLAKACLFLDQNGWEYELLDVKKDNTQQNKKRKAPGDPERSTGVVFYIPNRLDALRKYGRLTLLNSTHKTNHLKWPLYTFQVRDPGGTFLPVTHLLTDGEDSNILTAAMRQIKKAYNKGRRETSHWQP